MSDSFIPEDRLDELKRVRKYCREGGADGGMLMVCGPRGVGKTRLVDEALCEDVGKAPWWRKVFGDNHRRRQPEAIRPPRGMRRILIKVEVDPFFPHGVGGDEEGAVKQSHPGNLDESAFQLLRNLVFALTSLIDPRISQRQHGRTMRSRLGFWRYWFSCTALSWSRDNQDDYGKGRAISQAALEWLPLLAPMVFAILVECVCFCFGNCGQGQAVWRPLVFGGVLGVGVLVFLRWLDWRALSQFSGRLYDFVHAQEMRREAKESNTQMRGVSHKWDSGAILLLLGGVVGVLSAGLWEGWGSSADKLDLPLWIAVTGVVAGAGGGVWSWQRQRSLSNATHFGLRNPVWLITQLRRYLYLLHRTGIEPVLVFDELDKLETYYSGPRQTEVRLVEHPDLQRFIRTIERLRQMLSGDFVTVLVGGWGLATAYERSLANPFPNPLSSIVREAVYLAPVSPGAACKWWRENRSISDADGEGRLMWAYSKGYYARFSRYRIVRSVSPDHRKEILEAVDAVAALWEADNLIEQISERAPVKPWMNRIRQPGVKTLVRLGMVEYVWSVVNGDWADEDRRATPADVEGMIRAIDSASHMEFGKLMAAMQHKTMRNKQGEGEFS